MTAGPKQKDIRAEAALWLARIEGGSLDHYSLEDGVLEDGSAEDDPLAWDAPTTAPPNKTPLTPSPLTKPAPNLALPKDGGSQGAARQAFEAWLAADPRHARAYDEMASVYALLEAPARQVHARESHSFAPSGAYLADAHSTGAPSPSSSSFAASARNLGGFDRLRAAFRPRLGWLFPPALAAMIGAGFWLVTPGLIQNLQADIVSSRDLVSEITLPDGSRAYLGADTALALDFADGRRALTLLRGEAYFDVRHSTTTDAQGQFTVHVGPDQVRDIGTRFNVERQSSGAIVTVTQGEVEVQGSLDPSAQRLLEGDRLVLSDGHAQTATSSDPEAVLAWMDGRLVVEGARLDEVARTLERHAPGRIILRGHAQNRLISGTFPLGDVDGTLETMAAALDLSVIRITPYLIIIG